MTDKIYRVILLGKIAEGHDVEIVHEKLAIIFEIDLKKVPKLLKKPTVIRKNLTPEVALRYKEGLDKIGVLCEIQPPIEATVQMNIEPEPEPISTEPELTPISEDFATNDNPPSSESAEESETYSILENTTPFVLDSETLRVVNIKMSWWSMTKFIMKWILASIPAMMILGAIGYLITIVIKMLGLLP